MKVFYLGLLDISQKPAVQLCSEYDLSDVNRFARYQVQQVMDMLIATIADRTQPGRRQSVEENDYMFHIYARSEGVAAVLITQDYPSLTAHAVLSKTIDDFLALFPNPASRKPPVKYPALREQLQNAKDPAQANSIVQIQKELDETKIVLHKTIEKVLERGDKLDDLVAKSDQLSGASKLFYTQAKKQNSCCVLM